MLYLLVVIFLFVVFLMVVLWMFGVNQEYQCVVLFWFGWFGIIKGLGWYWLIFFIDCVVKVDICIVIVQLEIQEMIMCDGVVVWVNVVLWYCVVDFVWVVILVEVYQLVVVQVVEIGMCDVIG